MVYLSEVIHNVTASVQLNRGGEIMRTNDMRTLVITAITNSTYTNFASV
jgi:hypothetical protein